MYPFVSLDDFIGQGVVGEAFRSQKLGLVLKAGSREEGALTHEAKMYQKLGSCAWIPRFYGLYYAGSMEALLLEDCGSPLSANMWSERKE